MSGLEKFWQFERNASGIRTKEVTKKSEVLNEIDRFDAIKTKKIFVRKQLRKIVTY